MIQHNRTRESLLMNLAPVHQYDVEASVEKYIDLLTQSLQDEYPNARIRVTADFGNTQTELEMQRLAEGDWGWEEDIVNMQSNMQSEVFIRRHVDQLAEDVYQSFQWIIRNREWLPITEIGQRFQIPVYNLRWACKRGLLEDAKPYAGTWELPLEAILFR